MFKLCEKLFGNVMALNRYLRMRYIVPEIAKIENARVLDIGCLDGHFTRYLTGRGNEVFAVDIKDYGIKRALPEARFVLASGGELPFPDDSFDFVFCSDVVEHIENFEVIVPEIRRTLKPGGTCLISTVDGYWKSPLGLRSLLLRLPEALKKAVGRFAMTDKELHLSFMGHVRYDLTIDKLASIFEKAGLQVKKKFQFCGAAGSLLMEVFFSFNERLRYLIFPFLKALLPFDSVLRSGKHWQYYVIFEKS